MIEIEKQIYELINKMPSLPPTVMKVVSIANDVNAAARDLVSVIKLDPVLTGKVLKLINSSYFGLSSKIDNLNRAIILLGINTVKNLALSTAVVGTMNTARSKQSALDAESIWKHSLACAVASKALAREANAPKNELEEYFIAGLLHDIGVIFLVQYMSEAYLNLLESRASGLGTSLSEESDHFQMDHTEIGGLIAEKWGLNPNLAECIRYHHAFRKDGVNPMELAAVHAADCLVRRMGFGYPGEPAEDFVAPEAWTVLGVTEERAKVILAELPAEIEKASVFLQT